MSFDYKDTLNLPSTKFPMKANLANKEKNILQNWESISLYQQQQKLSKGRKRFVLTDGPPYANGKIHLGHALNKVLKDIINKSKFKSGYEVSYVPGWDCHGLPIELNVEKKHGKAGHKLSKSEFRGKCRNYAASQVAIQKDAFKRLGVVADWENPYLTMSFDFEAGVIKSLAKIIENGHLSAGHKPVHWCTDCGSALAEAEVEYQDKTSFAIDVAFDVVASEQLCTDLGLSNSPKKIALVIWTTTPWTLPANQAVAVHPELEYSFIELQSNQVYIVASNLVANFAERLEISDYKIIATCKGAALDKLNLQHPFYSRQVPVLLGMHVSDEAGTGCVHTAPSHGLDDYLLGKEANLEQLHLLDFHGRFKPDVEVVAGLKIAAANTKVIEVLLENNKLVIQNKIQHSYPHCWRHKTPLIFMATPQWFISMDKHKLRSNAISSTDEVTWWPSWGYNRINAMLKDRPDWCISRQRTWGVPIPIFVHKETKQLHPNTATIMHKVADAVAKEGIDAWFDKDDWLSADEQDLYLKSNDTLDVWFESGVVHANLHAANTDKVADLYLEGSDQHRGWFHSSLLTSLAMYARPPYKQVLTHGFAVDEHGRKMSKSLGNVIEPEKIINTLGADVLRLWISSVDYRYEIKASDEIFKRTSEAYRRIRNTARFLLANIHDFDFESNQVDFDNLLGLDKFILYKSILLDKDIKEAYENYNFHAIYHKLYNFCVNDLGGFFLDIIKDRQYTCATNSVARRSAQTVIYYVLELLVRWISPILSFTAEEIWGHMPARDVDSVFLTTWYDALNNIDLSKITVHMEIWENLFNIRHEFNKAIEALRNDGKIRSSLDAEVTLYVDDNLNTQLAPIASELKFVLISSKASIEDLSLAPEDSINTALSGLKIKVKNSDFDKCQRCWHKVSDVGEVSEHPDICIRCVKNISDENGEIRKYA